ncbi:hypothetical protein CsatB_002832 [Cannabis sativa]
MYSDGFRGFYKGFGISIVTYAPSNSVWWASYSVAHRLIWDGFGCYMGKKKKDENGLTHRCSSSFRPDSRATLGGPGSKCCNG